MSFDTENALLARIHAELDCTPVLRTLLINGRADTFEWTATYRRSIRHHGRTIATLAEDAVRAPTLEGVLRAILEREASRDGEMLACLRERAAE